jgi:hypothetical protein
MAVGGGTITTLTTTSDITVQGVTVGRGAGAVSTNTAVGASALAANTSGSTNTGIGYQAGKALTTGGDNTAIGQALVTATTGGSNIAVGNGSLYSTTTAGNNVAVGVGAAFSNTTGQYNIAVGTSALSANTTASYNTAIGYRAGYSFNRTSDADGVSLFAGANAGYSVTTGNYNTFVGGINSGYFVTTGSKNTILGGYNGNQGGLDIRTASNYIVLSDGDGNPRLVGNNGGNWRMNANPLVWGAGNGFTVNNGSLWGYDKDFRAVGNAFYNGSSAYERISTGYAAMLICGGGDGQIRTLTAGTNSAGTTFSWTDGPYVANLGTSWTNSSDERLKNITGEIQNGLAKVMTLRAAEFTWKSDDTATPQVGLIAQDVQAVLPEVISTSVRHESEDITEYLGVAYDQIIPLLVAAIKELKAEIDLLKGN